MARYNREFLVPYLQNICALHLADKKLVRRIEYWHEELRGLNNFYLPTKPSSPVLGDTKGGCLQVGLGVMSCMCLFALVCGILMPGFPGWAFALCGGSLLLYGIPFILMINNNHETERENEEKLEEYKTKLEQYNIDLEEAKVKIDQDRKEINEYIDLWTNERYKVRNLLQQAYAANVIPSHYREPYAAVYLYDWFSTGQANDMDHALSMFVLEEIKDRLDRIIANQSEVILNQRIMMAGQQRSIEQQRSFERTMKSKLDQIQATEEERLSYTRMIESNTSATAYFAAAEYIKDL